jgi:hypothetical protein
MSCHNFEVGVQPAKHIAATILAFPDVGRRIEATPIGRQTGIDPFFERTEAAIKPCERDQGRYPVLALDAKLNPVWPILVGLHGPRSGLGQPEAALH